VIDVNYYKYHIKEVGWQEMGLLFGLSYYVLNLYFKKKYVLIFIICK